MNNLYQEKFPFLTGLSHCDTEYVGVVANCDNYMVTFYDVEDIVSNEAKIIFLELGETWWWESNRQLPIEIFMTEEMIPFRYCLKTITMKDTIVLFGPMTSLQDLLKKKTKRRSIQLVKPPR